jgi:hypothetical protein
MLIGKVVKFVQSLLNSTIEPRCHSKNIEIITLKQSLAVVYLQRGPPIAENKSTTHHENAQNSGHSHGHGPVSHIETITAVTVTVAGLFHGQG